MASENYGAPRISAFAGDSAEYPEWHVKFMSLCREKKCADIIKPGAPGRPTGDTLQDQAAQEVYDAASEKLFIWLSRSVTGVAAKIVQKYDAKPNGSRLADGAGAYLELKEIYELQGDDQIASLQQQFHNITMVEGEDPDMRSRAWSR